MKLADYINNLKTENEAHTLVEVSEFPGKGTDEDGRPNPAYFRFYCKCSAVGGRRSTEDAALRGHGIHAEDPS